MPRSANFSLGDVIITALLLFIFWPWAVLLVDVIHWIITGMRLLPGLKDARLAVAALWPVLWFLVVSMFFS